VDDYSHLVGHRFPGGTVTVLPQLSWLWADAVGSSEPEEVHPSYAFAMAMEGMGITIDELLALADLGADEGSLAGDLALEFEQPLRVGASYRVDGEIVAMERKHGARMGTFDSLRFEITITDAESGELAVRTENAFLLPRAAA
jgi:hypothetical protein